jgi:1-acyl-sn-glycerol-3-phosphate acyltransferase
VKIKFFYYAGWTLTRVVSKVIFRCRVSGQEYVPRAGGFILASNHISYYDPPLLGSWSPRQMYFFAKAELFRNFLFGSVIRRTNALPVKRGTIDRESIRLAVDAIERGYGLTIFPEGTRSRTDGFLPPKAGLGLIARSTGCPIVPAYIHGSNRLSRCLTGRDRLSITFSEPLSSEWVNSFPADKQGYLEISRAVLERIARIKRKVAPAQGNGAG